MGKRGALSFIKVNWKKNDKQLHKRRTNIYKQVVPRVGRPAVMLTVCLETVMKKECYL